MILKKWLNKWEFNSLKLNAQFLEAEVVFNDVDKTAAWEMYVELLTRVTSQRLELTAGDDLAAIQSIYSIFPSTRNILKDAGPKCISFTKVAIPILNQILRPFLARWHKIFVDSNNILDDKDRNRFRSELVTLQNEINKVMRLLSSIAEVEDLSDYEL